MNLDSKDVRQLIVDLVVEDPLFREAIKKIVTEDLEIYADTDSEGDIQVSLNWDNEDTDETFSSSSVWHTHNIS